MDTWSTIKVEAVPNTRISLEAPTMWRVSVDGSRSYFWVPLDDLNGLAELVVDLCGGLEDPIELHCHDFTARDVILAKCHDHDVYPRNPGEGDMSGRTFARYTVS